MPDRVESVAVLGTGIMGAPMARNLAGAGIRTGAWNRTRETAAPLADDGIAVANSPAEAVDNVDAVITMLVDADAVRSVMDADGALAAMRDDAVWLQMSTVGIAGIAELASLAARAGIALVDAPVLGTKQPAKAGELVVLAAGPPDAVDASTPVFEAVGSRTIRLDEPGAATRMKLVLNNWVLSITVATAETIALAEHLGIEPAKFLEAIEGGPLDSAYAQMKGKMMIERSFDPAFPVRLAAKDVRLVLEAGERDGRELPLTRAVDRRLAETAELGHADEDMAAAYLAAARER